MQLTTVVLGGGSIPQEYSILRAARVDALSESGVGQLGTGITCWRILADSLHPFDKYGRPVGTRTPDLYRVKNEVRELKPFACFAFPVLTTSKKALKWPSFGDELVTSFFVRGQEQIIRFKDSNRLVGLTPERPC